MFLETIRSEGLAHLSYIIGDKGKAAVIDPRRDYEIYRDIAYHHDTQITHIFETHRNEDYLIGSKELAHQTGAEIYHSKHLLFQYGNPISEGDCFPLGNCILRILETPGHTYDSISIVLADKGFSTRDPIAVFTGDALFIGDVGRTDFFPDKPEEVAGLLYDSIFKKLLPMGDQVILHPAHGAGSVCGAGIASRDFSTLGYERKYNPILQKNRDEFIRHKVNEHHYKPPYFKRMHRLNQEGAPLLKNLPKPAPGNVEEFDKAAMSEEMIILDVRSPEAFAGAYIPGSIAIPLEMIPSFAGWFLPYDKPIGLIVDGYDQVETAVRYLIRIGYDIIFGYLENGVHKWEISGRKYESIPTVYAGEIIRRIKAKEDLTLLDVRSKEEFEKGHLPNAINVYVGELPDNLDKIPRDHRSLTVFCSTGKRATIAASLLKKNGFEEVENWLGSMTACSAIGCPIVT
ncbi:MAG: Metallo-beta-lactamase family protein [Candidatus Jettenia ecosi]|uniref:Metallo-beta-lactamase family protein n=1 Tax=Candidatus Jettenia ecosi TaxID=2494326 RepID=A0A533QEL7_9BACT|nr:MAG: Metallo-beta-lactamase family protein [Candidatus Jettenia ecosi]